MEYVHLPWHVTYSILVYIIYNVASHKNLQLQSILGDWPYFIFVWSKWGPCSSCGAYAVCAVPGLPTQMATNFVFVPMEHGKYANGPIVGGV